MDIFFEAFTEHQWEYISVAAQSLPVHPSHDLTPTPSAVAPPCNAPCAEFVPFVGERHKSQTDSLREVLGLEGQQKLYQALNQA